jgi:hypothetical protein
MECLSLKLDDGNLVEVKHKEAGNFDSRFIFSIWKSGSTLLFKLVDEICQMANLPNINIDDALFAEGYMPRHLEEKAMFQPRGYIYSGFRYCWMEFSAINDSNSLLLVRDPRDALVSHYFSTYKSHKIPASGPIRNLMKEQRSNFVLIDEYVCSEPALRLFKDNLNKYIDLMQRCCVICFRYEDIIFRKVEFVRFLAHFLGAELDEQLLIDMAQRHDLRPQKENPDSHVRQVSPGNFRAHLKSETIEFLDREFDSILKTFGYDAVTPYPVHHMEE